MKKTAKKCNNVTPTNATVNEKTILSYDNIESVSQRIAVKALKTIIAKSGHEHIYRLYGGLVGDITDKDIKNILSDGYDIVSEAKIFLLAYIGKSLDEVASGNEVDKEGKPISILRACFRAVNRYIMGERQKQYKQAYVDDIDPMGNILYYEIPLEWDMPTAMDYTEVTKVINALNLTKRELQVIKYRLRGIAVDNSTIGKRGQRSQATKTSNRTIAEKMGVSEWTIRKILKTIQSKYLAYKQGQKQS